MNSLEASSTLAAVGTESSAADGARAALRLPELLAPAGDWECARAAVENGADAIYFGLEKFNARMRAHNFTESDLPGLVEYLHRRGVKGYVTLNTLVFENEMAQAEHYLRTMIAAGVDAVIVQDVGICRLIRKLSTDFPVHASTQMTITSAGGIEFARELGCNLVVLARECSLSDIEKIQASQAASAHSRIPLEVFVHGALCVAYSGQCLTSEALGGRSANRGECAQACRMPYDLVADGQTVALGDRKYLLSPQDLAGLDLLPELARAGVASLKIEGRLKSPEYVANITGIYRKALDSLNQALGQPSEPRLKEENPPTPVPAAHAGSPQYAMEMAFSRGLYTGWFRGTNNQALVHARFGKKRGVYLGEVAEVRHSSVLLPLEGPLKPGDGIVFDAGRPEEKEEGGRVYEIHHAKPVARNTRKGWPWVELGFGRADVDFRRVHVGDKLWKTSDPELDRRLQQTYQGHKPRFQRPISVEVHGFSGKALSIVFRDELGHVVRLDSAMPLASAERQPLTTARLTEQLGRLGGTPFRLGDLKNALEGEVVLPISELNRLRRAAVEKLETLRAKPGRWTLLGKGRSLAEPSTKLAHQGKSIVSNAENGGTSPSEARLIVLVRTLAQLEAAMCCGIRTVYCDFEDPKKYRDAVRVFHESALEEGVREIFVAPPRIFKPGEEWTLRQVQSCEADGYLVRNYEHLNFYAKDRCVGDYSLNVANSLAADHFKNRFKLERVAASYDLNFAQLESLLRAAPAEWFEVTIHQHMPMFHMEHCVFCAFLSSGTDYTNCGRPCDKHDLKLRDRVGAQHPVKADVGCRNTVFNALAQTGAEYVSRMLALGVRHFRIEFLNETPEQVTQTIAKYRQLLAGEISGAELWKELKLFNQLGVTRGQMAG